MDEAGKKRQRPHEVSTSTDPADPKSLLRALFDAAVDAVRPEHCVPQHLPPPPARRAGRTIVVGAGKAAAAMARAVEDSWHGPLSGLVVTAYGHGVRCRRIEVIEAGHPLPDAAAAGAAERILDAVAQAGADDVVLCLISGGGSALLTLPAPGITLADKRETTRALLLGGAAISEINCVRKHLSAIKGGRLAAAAHPARVHTLIISDVPGDDAATVASGPTVADATSFADARAVLAKYGIEPPAAVAAHLAAAAVETPKPGDQALDGASATIIARARDALQAAARRARGFGVEPVMLGDDIEGEARDVAAGHAVLAAEIAAAIGPTAPPRVLLSGGETTVTVGPAGGRGGRNTEYLLALAAALADLGDDARIWALACDSDGIDGSGDAAGAVLAPDSVARAAALGLDAVAVLDRHDSHAFFAALDDLIVTGPTRTNVNDIRAILIRAGAAQQVEL